MLHHAMPPVVSTSDAAGPLCGIMNCEAYKFIDW